VMMGEWFQFVLKVRQVRLTFVEGCALEKPLDKVEVF
jgi:hypothetical protein